MVHTMQEVVIALLLMLMERSRNIEYKNSMSECLKGRRVASRGAITKYRISMYKINLQKQKFIWVKKSIKSLILE